MWNHIHLYIYQVLSNTQVNNPNWKNIDVEIQMMFLLIIFLATPSGQNLSRLTWQLQKKEKKRNLMKMQRRGKKLLLEYGLCLTWIPRWWITDWYNVLPLKHKSYFSSFPLLSWLSTHTFLFFASIMNEQSILSPHYPTLGNCTTNPMNLILHRFSKCSFQTFISITKDEHFAKTLLEL